MTNDFNKAKPQAQHPNTENIYLDLVRFAGAFPCEGFGNGLLL